MELRHLRYFIAVAEKLNFTEAARSLHIAQPSLSLQIQDLERTLGLSLIQRNNRSVKLTPAGEVFLKEARELLEQAEEAITKTHRADRGEIGELRVGFIYVAVQNFMAPLLSRFQALSPGVTVHITHMPNAEQVAAINNRQLDVGFARIFNQEAYPDLQSILVMTDTLMVVVAEDHPVAGQDSFRPEQFRDYAIVPYARSESPLLFQTVLQQFGPAEFTSHKVNEPYMIDTALMLVEAGFGITLVPGCARQLRTGKLKFLPIDAPTPPIDLFMVSRKDSASNPIVESFTQQVMALSNTQQMVCS
jgi:DNA-binding transcriptional LysR family regulator